jgi:hypothetical protein
MSSRHISALGATAGRHRPLGLGAWLGRLIARQIPADRRLLWRSAPPREAVIATLGSVQLRRLRPVFMARTMVNGDPDAALPTALQRLADYIGGDNREALRVQVARPVVWQPRASGTWQVQIGLPEVYNACAAPLPRSGKVRIISQPGETLAVIRLSGRPCPQALAQGEAAILSALTGGHWVATGPTILRLHAPFGLLPWMGSFEVAIAVDEHGRSRQP